MTLPWLRNMQCVKQQGSVPLSNGLHDVDLGQQTDQGPRASSFITQGYRSLCALPLTYSLVAVHFPAHHTECHLRESRVKRMWYSTKEQKVERFFLLDLFLG